MSKNEEKVQRAEAERRLERSRGTLQTRFPSVLRLKIGLRFLGPQKQVLKECGLQFDPEQACELEMECPGRCGVGVFDFSTLLAQAVEIRQPVCESLTPCSQPSYPGSREACGCSVSFRAELEYLPQEA
jgi:hypothetical protein